jgi:hypothetical protein
MRRTAWEHGFPLPAAQAFFEQCGGYTCDAGHRGSCAFIPLCDCTDIEMGWHDKSGVVIAGKYRNVAGSPVRTEIGASLSDGVLVFYDRRKPGGLSSIR